MALAGATLYACTGGGRKKPPRVTPSATKSPTQWPVKHVLYLMVENRSFNNLFGKFPGVNVTTTGV